MQSSENSEERQKDPFSEDCKGIEENNRRKTRDLFKKIGYIKGILHPKMGTIMDRNGKDLIEAGEIKKIWQEYTEELYIKVVNDLVNHDDVVTHPEPDILECEDKWALGSTADIPHPPPFPLWSGRCPCSELRYQHRAQISRQGQSTSATSQASR